MQNSFNNTVIPEVIRYLSYILDRVSKRDKAGRVIKLYNYSIVEPENTQLGDLIQSGTSEMYNINLTLHIINTDGIVTVQESTIEVPRMINNIFIIDGKSRIATNTFGNDYLCRIHDNGNLHKIVFDYNREVRWSFPKGVKPQYSPLYFKFVGYDEDGEDLVFDGFPENYETYKSLLMLTPEQKNKLKIKLDREDIPDYINYELVGDLYALGDDRQRDSVIDRRVNTIESDFISHLRMADNKRLLITNISAKWFKYGRIYLKDFQNVITKYFRVAQTKYIEIPRNVNPLVYDALRYKIVFPGYLMYNESFTDLIDPANTPENNNVNIINEMNVCTSVKDGVLYYHCYDYKTKARVVLPYMEYLTKRVLSNECFDYEKMEVKKLDLYKYRLRLKHHTCKSLSDVEFDLIEPAPDEKLSLTSRRIPLINMSDSVRVAMGAAMIRQSIETAGSEPRLVDTGNDNEDYIYSTNLTTYSGLNSGEVVDIRDNEVFIKDSVTGMVVPYTIQSPTVGANKALITFESKVKVGDKVNPGDVVIHPASMRGDTYNLGINAHAVYMNYLGYTYEDGVVVSQSYADKATHYSVVQVSASVRSGDTLRLIRQIGSKVTSRELLVCSQGKLEVSDEVGNMLLEDNKTPSVMKAIGLSQNKKNLLVPNNTDEGYIVDVRIDYKPVKKGDKITLKDYTKKIIEDFESSPKLTDYEVLPESYRTLKCSKPTEWGQGVQAIITFKLVRVNRMKIGDKSANSYGSKGIISLILPDECMPRLDTDGQGNGPAFDIIMNPAAVIGRKNVSQLYECALSKCIEKIYLDVKSMRDQGRLQDAKSFTEQFYGSKYLEMSDEEFNSTVDKGLIGFKMNVGSYSRVSYDQMLGWMDILGIKEDDDIYVPDVVIYEDEQGTKACSPEYAAANGINGKYHELGFPEGRVITGRSYMYKLYHAADYNGKVTNNSVNRVDPIMGRGLKRDSGQKIGEMELWALMSYGATDFLVKNNPDIDRDQNVFLNELLLSGFVLTDSMGIPFNTEYRSNLRALREKYD